MFGPSIPNHFGGSFYQLRHLGKQHLKALQEGNFQKAADIKALIDEIREKGNTRVLKVSLHGGSEANHPLPAQTRR